MENVDINEYAALLVPGGFGYYGFYEEAYHPDFLNLIKAFDEAGKNYCFYMRRSIAFG